MCNAAVILAYLLTDINETGPSLIVFLRIDKFYVGRFFFFFFLFLSGIHGIMKSRDFIMDLNNQFDAYTVYYDLTLGSHGFKQPAFDAYTGYYDLTSGPHGFEIPV